MYNPIDRSYEDDLHAEIDELRAEILELKLTIKLVRRVLGTAAANLDSI